MDAVLPALRECLTQKRFVLQAEPGAGKTTRVPGYVLEHCPQLQGELWVTQPRQVAARMAARFVARALGEDVGETCGYQVRFESKVSPRTRLRFVTEGILTRALTADPTLSRVGGVIFDEFHERSLASDVALACVRQLSTTRPELVMGVMSATLDAEPLAQALGCVPIFCEGRAYPVDVRYARSPSDAPLARQVLHAVRELVAEVTGGILVFLPGMAEIRACAELLAPVCAAEGRALHTLHGELDARAQDAALAGGATGVVLTTNVAETSLTVEGIAAVVDSGLARRAQVDVGTGLTTLRTVPISRASAVQRTGRAGRTGPGLCVRLYTEADFERRPSHERPDIARLDLAGVVLELAAGGFQLDALPWFEAPPAAHVTGARELLKRLGAMDANNVITPRGRAMAALPLHPRLARTWLEGQARGVERDITEVVAWLSEGARTRRGVAQSVGHSDVVAALEQGAARTGRTRLLAEQLKRTSSTPSVRASADRDEALGLALLSGFSDRLARRRSLDAQDTTLVMATGGHARLAPESIVLHSELLLALVTFRSDERGRAYTSVRVATEVQLEWLLELFPERLDERVRVSLSPSTQRAEGMRETLFDAFVVARQTLPGDVLRALPQTLLCLQREIDSLPLEKLCDADAWHQLRARVRWAVGADVLTEQHLRETLRARCQGALALRELETSHAMHDTLARVQPGLALDQHAPTHLVLRTGRRLQIHYSLDAPPYVASYLQDFLGMTRAPTVGDSALTVHLWAPNRRAVQVTSDLEGFWRTHYPKLRTALMRRYPKHAWPEDPLGARSS